MRPRLDLRSFLQAVLTRHFLERKTGCYQLYSADQVRVAVEDTIVACPWNFVRLVQHVPNMVGQVMQPGNQFAPIGQPMMPQFAPQMMPPQGPNPLAQMMPPQGGGLLAQLLQQANQQVDLESDNEDKSDGDAEPSNPVLETESKVPFQEDPAKFPRCEPSENGWPNDWEKTLSDTRCSAYFELYVPAVVKALEAHPGQLFVAGGCFTEMFLHGRPSSDGDFDLFVCAENAQEGEKVMASAAAILETEMAKNSTLGIVNVTTTTQATSFSAWNNQHYYTQKIQIIRRLYPVGRHDMIPGCFDLWPSQFIWSPSTGFQATLPGLASLIVRGFPVDLARRSPAMMKRITKYVDRKKFTCYLMGVNPENPQESFGWQHPTNDRIGEQFARTFGNPGTYLARNSFGIGAEYDFPNEEAKEEEAEHRVFVEENPTVWDNLRCALSEKPHILLKLRKYADFCTEHCDIGASLLGEFINLREVKRMNRKTLRKFFKDEDIRTEFATAFFGSEDKDESQRLWRKNTASLAAPFVPLFCGETHPSKYWKVDNPGAQGFGQNCPRPIHPRNYYGEHYYPTLCGVPSIEVLTVRYLKKTYGWPLDVERLLCRYLLSMHASDVYRMLKL